MAVYSLRSHYAFETRPSDDQSVDLRTPIPGHFPLVDTDDRLVE